MPEDHVHVTINSAAASETIGQRLRRLRTDRRLSQRELASPGVSYAYISRIEAGTRQPSVKALRMLARKLGVSAEYLETGRELGATEHRELELADAELAIRLADDSSAAEETLTRIVEEALQAGDRGMATRARIALGLAAVRQGRHPEAIAQLEEALGERPVSPVTRPDIYATLGRSYVAAGMNDRAVELFDRCLADITEQAPENTAAQVRFATYLSQALANVGDLGRAQTVVMDALERAKGFSDPYTQVRLYWSLARLASLRGQAQVALDHVRRAIALLEATEDTLQLARAHLLCAAIMNLQGRGVEARPQLVLAERMLGESPDRVDLASLRAEQAKSAALLGEPEEAIERARESLELIGDDDPAEQGGALYALAQGLALTGEIEESDEAFRRAVDLLAEEGHWRECAVAYRTWARLLRQTGREAEALDVLERAADLAARTESIEARAPR
jgi:tetratricopeptide (TPR) repeat protein